MSGRWLPLIDLLCVAELAWSVVWLSGKPLREALLLAGGVVSSGYVAAQCSSWLAQVWVKPTSAVVVWVHSRLNTDAGTVNALSRFLPSEPAWSGLSATQWIAWHVVQGVLFILMTAAIFAVFRVTVFLSHALWDIRNPRETSSPMVTNIILGTGCGLYAAALTCLLLVQLAWIKDLPALGHALNDSAWFHVLASLRALA